MISKSAVIKDLKEVLRWKAICKNNDDELLKIKGRMIASDISYEKARISLRKRIEDCPELHIKLQEELYRIRPVLKDDIVIELITINAKDE